MANHPLPSPEDLRQLLDMDPDAGTLVWRERDVSWFRRTKGRTAAHACANWNARYAGKEAFTSVDAYGYRIGAIGNMKYKAHRVIWAMAFGSWPVGDVDHINEDKSDNRLSNLREASRSENMRNRGATRRNHLGLKGVSWDSNRQKWLSQIRLDGKNKYLGRFDCPHEAHAAYEAASRSVHGEFAKA